MEGYKEANKIDRLIGNSIAKHPIVVDNLHDWRIFIRTVRTTLDIIESVVIAKVKAEHEKALQKRGMILERDK